MRTEFNNAYADIINEELEEESTVRASTFNFNFVLY